MRMDLNWWTGFEIRSRQVTNALTLKLKLDFLKLFGAKYLGDDEWDDNENNDAKEDHKYDKSKRAKNMKDNVEFKTS